MTYDKPEIVKIFIAGAEDVSDLKELALDSIRRCDESIDGFFLAPKIWDSVVSTSSKKTPQLQIDNEIYQYDILLAFIGGSIGESNGTIHEIDLFERSNKEIIVYFDDSKVTTNTPQEDFSKICDLKGRIKSIGTFWDLKREELDLKLQKDIKEAVTSIKDFDGPNLQTPITGGVKIARDANKLKPSGNLKISISREIEKELELRKRLPKRFRYLPNITYNENRRLLWNSPFELPTDQASLPEEIKILDRARTKAFDTKYGRYNMADDVRNSNSDWIRRTEELMKQHTTINDIDIVDFGGNNGDELSQICSTFDERKFARKTVVDLSETALRIGEKRHSDIEFIKGDIEYGFDVKKRKYDVALCLRTITSRGLSYIPSIINMSTCVKSNGILIISVPNSFIDDDGITQEGLYDHRTDSIHKNRPYEVAIKVLKKMVDFGFAKTNIVTTPTEILITGRKNND
ncbi:hypothetical protein FACS1894125_2440 [Actinomycetota bacterium]|nr:hypothetical protein FACS1894125_2440 [Actinomycetota bacterium]